MNLGGRGKSLPFCFAYTVTQDTSTYTFPTLSYLVDIILMNRKRTDTSFPYPCSRCIWGSISFHLYWWPALHHHCTLLPEFAVSTATGTSAPASKLEPWGDHLSAQPCLELYNSKAHKDERVSGLPCKSTLPPDTVGRHYAFCGCTLPVSSGAGKRFCLMSSKS